MKTRRTKLMPSSSNSIVFVALIVCAVMLFTISWTAFTAANKQDAQIEGNYITIGVPVVQNSEDISKLKGAITIENHDAYGENQNTIPLSEALVVSEYYIATDNRILLSAHIPGSSNLSSGTFDELDYNAAFDRYTYGLSVLAVRCTSVAVLTGKVTKHISSLSTACVGLMLIITKCWMMSFICLHVSTPVMVKSHLK